MAESERAEKWQSPKERKNGRVRKGWKMAESEKGWKISKSERAEKFLSPKERKNGRVRKGWKMAESEKGGKISKSERSEKFLSPKKRKNGRVRKGWKMAESERAEKFPSPKGLKNGRVRIIEKVPTTVSRNTEAGIWVDWAWWKNFRFEKKKKFQDRFLRVDGRADGWLVPTRHGAKSRQPLRKWWKAYSYCEDDR